MKLFTKLHKLQIYSTLFFNCFHLFLFLWNESLQFTVLHLLFQFERMHLPEEFIRCISPLYIMAQSIWKSWACFKTRKKKSFVLLKRELAAHSEYIWKKKTKGQTERNHRSTTTVTGTKGTENCAVTLLY